MRNHHLIRCTQNPWHAFSLTVFLLVCFGTWLTYIVIKWDSMGFFEHVETAKVASLTTSAYGGANFKTLLIQFSINVRKLYDDISYHGYG